MLNRQLCWILKRPDRVFGLLFTAKDIVANPYEFFFPDTSTPAQAFLKFLHFLFVPLYYFPLSFMLYHQNRRRIIPVVHTVSVKKCELTVLVGYIPRHLNDLYS
jgi:hypothetical protein